MDLNTGIITACISAIVSIAIAKINSYQQKEAQMLNLRPYLSIKMVIPDNDGITGTPIKYHVSNLGNGVAFRPEIKDVFRTIDGNVQGGVPTVYQFDYDVILQNSELLFSVDWERDNRIQADPTTATNEVIMDELVKDYLELPRRSVIDNIRIHYYDSLDNKYEQIATVEYSNPYKPVGIKERISAPVRIGK